MSTNLSLFPRSRSSFDVNDIESSAELLLQHDYFQEQTHNNLTEYARFRGVHSCPIRIRHSGTVVLARPATWGEAVQALPH